MSISWELKIFSKTKENIRLHSPSERMSTPETLDPP